MSTNIMALVTGNRPPRTQNQAIPEDDCPGYEAAVTRRASRALPPSPTCRTAYATVPSILSSSAHHRRCAQQSRCFDPVQQFECHQYGLSLSALTTIPAHAMASRPLPLVVSRSSSVNSSALLSRSTSRHTSGRSEANFKRFVYTYNMLAAQTPMQFYISVEPFDGKPAAGQYQFRLSMRVNGIERPLGDPVTRIMSVDPRRLEFAVFVFPGKNAKQVLPINSLWSLRVWLRVEGVDHQLFRVDELLVGKDLDFNAIGDASFARQAALAHDHQVYRGYVGKALITFTVRWHRIRDQLYKYSMEYDGGGVGDVLFSDFRMRVDNDPRAVTFLIYTIPVQSMPPGATHRLRVWARSLVPLTNDPAISQPLPFNDSFIYQRIYKTDEFKVGGRLEFNALGNKLVMAFPHTGGPETINMARSPIKPQEKEKEKERGKEKERDRDREKEKIAMSSTSQASHAYSHQTHALPPGAQYPAHMLGPQTTHMNSALGHYQPQLPSLYPNTHPNPIQPLRAGDARERARSPPQVQKSRGKIEIV
ncbi:hypothetical protein NP233_g5500 [Leucocoprinus birnbaumii]|uniref:Uncharacterized protein n=1 Tax=Leucocoprinus birnbaumii TaxID=56174 RepID=A0AAD5VVE3_9AGAR|nr:hypothetical protein NP233_g5500 [Leucocoprinus birnbaumii]